MAYHTFTYKQTVDIYFLSSYRTHLGKSIQVLTDESTPCRYQFIKAKVDSSHALSPLVAGKSDEVMNLGKMVIVHVQIVRLKHMEHKL